jgi:beta-glucanase (GH16 family)
MNFHQLMFTVNNLVSSSNRVLSWSDEFNVNGAFNASNWNAQIGNGVNGWGNNELEYYTNSNAFVRNNMLTIEARKESINSFKYTSSRLVSKKAFKYGIFEARIKLPKGAGSWPAFWLLSSKTPLNWPADGKNSFIISAGKHSIEEPILEAGPK